MEKELHDFKCALEATLVTMQKAGTIKDFYEMAAFTEQEQWIKDYITKMGIDFFVNQPIGDEEFRRDSKLFQQRLPDLGQELYIDFRLFEDLVMKHLKDNYNTMKISFRQITGVSEFSRMLPDNQLLLENKKEHLYISLSFHDQPAASKPEKHYLVFNLDRYYEFDDSAFDRFTNTTLGGILTAASNDGYVADSICYNLVQVRQYIDRIKTYLTGCLKKNILRIDFIPCIGRKKTVDNSVKESVYFASMPAADDKKLLNDDFPYYDQGSLEP